MKRQKTSELFKNSDECEMTSAQIVRHKTADFA